jgi:hypothetical protein
MAADERAVGHPKKAHDEQTGPDESFREAINRIPAFVCILSD